MPQPNDNQNSKNQGSISQDEIAALQQQLEETIKKASQGWAAYYKEREKNQK